MPRVVIGPAVPDGKALDTEIARLRGLGVGELRAKWHTASRRRAPPHLPRHLLFHILAYRLQADRLGELDADSRRLLDRIGSGSSDETDGLVTDLNRTRTELKPGTLLTREWDGRPQRVMVLAVGFFWNGKTYPSLSKVACAITGTRWSGPRFFGLDQSPLEVRPCRARPCSRAARPSTPACRPSTGLSRTSTRWMPSMTPRRPISAVRLMPAGPRSGPATMTAAIPGARPSGRRCRGCWPT